jgi:antitoxin PrlF
MVATVHKVRLGAKAQVVLPKEAREALGLKPGDSFAFVIDGEDIRVVRASAEGDDPFACFSEWASEADRKGYADLCRRRA